MVFQGLGPIWADRGGAPFGIRAHALLPLGCANRTCPKCGASSVIAAIICWEEDGSQVIASSDESDPDLLCTACWFWWDS